MGVGKKGLKTLDSYMAIDPRKGLKPQRLQWQKGDKMQPCLTTVSPKNPKFCPVGLYLKLRLKAAYYI